jgi:hypothetical protein
MKLYITLTKYSLLMLLLVGGMVLSYVPNSIAATSSTLAIDVFGAHLVLQPTTLEASPTELAQIQAILTTRLTQAKLNGAFEVKVVAQHIEVNLSEGQDAPIAAPLMSHVGQIQFIAGGIDTSPLDNKVSANYPTLFTSNQVTDFTLPKSGDIFYRLGLNDVAATHMATFNATQPRHTICMVMDGELLNCSSMYYWSKNSLEIVPNLSGDSSVTMSNLALFIKSGALPLSLRLE